MPQTVELLIKRSLDTIVNLRRRKHLTVFGGIAYCRNLSQTMSLHDLGPAKYHVRRECGIGIEMLLIHRLVTDRLPGERRFIHAKVHRIQ